jgi:hypothetical protein
MAVMDGVITIVNPGGKELNTYDGANGNPILALRMPNFLYGVAKNSQQKLILCESDAPPKAESGVYGMNIRILNQTLSKKKEFKKVKITSYHPSMFMDSNELFLADTVGVICFNIKTGYGNFPYGRKYSYIGKNRGATLCVVARGSQVFIANPGYNAFGTVWIYDRDSAQKTTEMGTFLPGERLSELRSIALTDSGLLVVASERNLAVFC